MPPTTYTARWIVPIDVPPIDGGCVTIADGKIVALSTHQSIHVDVDLGDVAVLPGFVNAHTHLDLSGARGLCPITGDFTHWLRQVIAFRMNRTPEQVQSDIASGIAECLRFGTTCIGDISAGGASWALLQAASCRSVVFHEVLGLTAERAEKNLRTLDADLARHHHSDRSIAGISPHAPYSVRSSLNSELAKRSHSTAIHLGETRDELELLRSHTGPFVDFLKELGVWDADGLVADPEAILRLFPNGIFVHGNYLDPAQTFTPGQTVVLCPRTHRAFRHSRHPFPAWLERGVRIAIGTDSLASNPDLDILAEARHLHASHPEVVPTDVLRMLTQSGAEALGLDTTCGTLTSGKSADLVVVPLARDGSSGVAQNILQSRFSPTSVMWRGDWVIDDAIHRIFRA
ncbi:MAG: hypothetical protein EXS16_08425 [Gemmataceae bacterium]|nr:hypothetical protein [Gemmataceae bacterium]